MSRLLAFVISASFVGRRVDSAIEAALGANADCSTYPRANDHESHDLGSNLVQLAVTTSSAQRNETAASMTSFRTEAVGYTVIKHGQFIAIMIMVAIVCVLSPLLWCHRVKDDGLAVSDPSQPNSGSTPSKTEEGEHSRSTIILLANVWPTLFLAGVSTGILAPLESYISLNFFAQGYTTLSPSKIHCESAPDTAYCTSAVNDNVRWTAIAMAISTLIHFAFGPMVGVMSDAYGRQPILVVCGLLGMVPSVAQALFIYYNVSLYFWYGTLVFASVPVLAVWFASITDRIPNPQDRSSAFGLTLVAWEVSMLIGMVVGSFLSLKTAVAAALIFHTANVAYLVVGLDESLPPERRTPMKHRSLLPVAGLSILIRNSDLQRLCVVFMLSEFIGSGLGTVGTSYFQKYMDWKKNDNYTSMILVHLSMLCWVGCVLPQLVGIAGEVGLLFFAQAAGTVLDIGLFFTTRASQVFVLQGSIAGAMALTFPAIAALKGGMVDDTEQGHIQGAVQSAKSVAFGLGPVCFGALFNTLDTTKFGTTVGGQHLSRFIFILGALLHCCLFPVIVSLPRDVLSQSPSATDDT